MRVIDNQSRGRLNQECFSRGRTNLRERLPHSTSKGVPAYDYTRHEQTPCILGLEIYERPLLSPLTSSMEELRRTWDFCVSGMARIFQVFLGRYGGYLPSGFRPRPERQQWGLHTRELPMGDETNQLPEQKAVFVEDLRGSARPDSNSQTEWGETLDTAVSPTTRVAVAESGNSPCGLSEQVFDLLDCGHRHRFTVRGGPDYPALIAHNCSQALARDIFADMLVRVHKAGIKIIMHVHDELVCEVPDDQAEDSLKRVLEIMHTPPDWIPDIPVAAEGTLTPYYTK